jgi:hypothetical protein
MVCNCTPTNVTQLSKTQHLTRPRPTSPDLTFSVWLGVAGRGWVWWVWLWLAVAVAVCNGIAAGMLFLQGDIALRTDPYDTRTTVCYPAASVLTSLVSSCLNFCLCFCLCLCACERCHTVDFATWSDRPEFLKRHRSDPEEVLSDCISAYCSASDICSK